MNLLKSQFECAFELKISSIFNEYIAFNPIIGKVSPDSPDIKVTKAKEEKKVEMDSKANPVKLH